MSYCECLPIGYRVVVDHPIFEYVLGCKVVDVNLKMIDFDIKVENENDNRITSDITQTYVRVCSTQIVQILFYRTFVLLSIPRKKVEIPLFLCMGVSKTNCMDWKCSRDYSWFIHRPSSKFYLVDIFKTQQNQAKFNFYSNKYVIVPHIVKTH